MRFCAMIGVAAIVFLAGCSDAVPANDSKASPDKFPAGSANATSSDQKPSEAQPTRPATRKAGIDWPIFLGPGQDSHSPEKGIVTKWPAEGLKIVWQKKLGTSYGAPAISGGRLFQFDRFDPEGEAEQFAVSRGKARLYCLNAETGQEIWRHEYPTSYQDLYGYNNGPRCSPVVDEDRVYAYGADGRLLCCAVEDGKLLWEVDTAKQFGVVQNFFGVGSTPVIEGDKLIAMVGGSPPESLALPPGVLDRVEGNGSGIVAFDKRTGKVLYKITDELASYASLKLATIDGRRWCFAFCRGGLVGFEPESGKVDFHYPWRADSLESVNASMPVVVGDEVFISETYGPGSSLLKVSPGKHEVVWRDDDRKRDKAMQTHWMTPVAVGEHLYGSSGRHTENAELKCIEWKTGKTMWSVPGMTRSSLLVIDSHMLCLGEYGQLTLMKLNPEKLEQVAAIDYGDPELSVRLLGPAAAADRPEPLLKYPCWAAPIVSHGLLYIRGDDRLICLEIIPQR